MTDGFALLSWVISLVNKVTKKSNKYSNEESVVGTWADGKPIYRRVVKMNNVVSGTEIFANSSVIDTVVKIGGTASYAYGWFSYRVSVPYTYPGQTVGLYWQKDFNKWFITTQVTLTDITIFVDYTKTTDKATK